MGHPHKIVLMLSAIVTALVLISSATAVPQVQTAPVMKTAKHVEHTREILDIGTSNSVPLNEYSTKDFNRVLEKIRTFVESKPFVELVGDTKVEKIRTFVNSEQFTELAIRIKDLLSHPEKLRQQVRNLSANKLQTLCAMLTNGMKSQGQGTSSFDATQQLQQLFTSEKGRRLLSSFKNTLGGSTTMRAMPNNSNRGASAAVGDTSETVPVTLRLSNKTGVEKITQEMPAAEAKKLSSMLTKAHQAATIINNPQIPASQKENAQTTLHHTIDTLRQHNLLPSDVTDNEALRLVTEYPEQQAYQIRDKMKNKEGAPQDSTSKHHIENTFCFVSGSGKANITYVSDSVLFILGCIPLFILVSPVLIPTMPILIALGLIIAISFIPMAPFFLMFCIMILGVIPLTFVLIPALLLGAFGHPELIEAIENYFKALSELVKIISQYLELMEPVFQLFAFFYEIVNTLLTFVESGGEALVSLNHLIPFRPMIGGAMIHGTNLSLSTIGLSGYKEASQLSEAAIAGFSGIWIEVHRPSWTFWNCMGFALHAEGSKENKPPVASFKWNPHTPDPGETITFDARNSTDPDGTIQRYDWDWDNDGTYDESHPTPTASHQWSEEGSYPVTLRVSDDSNATANETQTVIVEYSDRDTATFYFTDYDPNKAWEFWPEKMANHNTSFSNHAWTPHTGDVERLTSNSFAGGHTEPIMRVELRTYGFALDGKIILRPIFGGTYDGNNHDVYVDHDDFSDKWSKWVDITNDNNAPSEWSWDDLSRLDCDVQSQGKDFSHYDVYTVEIRVTYQTG